MHKVFFVITFIGIFSSLSSLAIAGNGNSANGQPFQDLQNQIDDNYTDIIDHEDRIQVLENNTGNNGNIIGRVIPHTVTNLQPFQTEQFIFRCDPGETIVSTDYLVDHELNVIRAGHNPLRNFFVLRVTPIGNLPISGNLQGILFCRQP